MSEFLEALIVLFPPDAGGRTGTVEPRAGSYRPFLRDLDTRARVRIRLIEGPPRLRAGDEALVVAEVEAGAIEAREMELVERDDRVVGRLTVLRTWAPA